MRAYIAYHTTKLCGPFLLPRDQALIIDCLKRWQSEYDPACHIMEEECHIEVTEAGRAYLATEIEARS